MTQPGMASMQPSLHNQGDLVSDSDGILVTPAAVGTPAAAKNGRVAAFLDEAPYVNINVTSGNVGQNNHTFDYGFGPSSKIELKTDSIRLCSGETTTLTTQAENVLPGDSVAVYRVLTC